MSEVKSENIQFDTMVIFSTLNQIVNYIPIKQYGIKNIINISVSDNNKLYTQIDNEQWDKNLKNALYNEKSEELSESFDLSTEDEELLNEWDRIEFKTLKVNKKLRFPNEILSKLEALELGKYIEDNNIIWNITGGQRHYILGILSFIRKHRNDKKDKILYFDGNYDDFVVVNANEYLGIVDGNTISKKFTQEVNSKYIEDLYLQGVLDLANFDITKEPNNYLKQSNNQEINNILKINEIFKEKTEKGKKLRKLLLLLNRREDKRKKLCGINKNSDDNDVVEDSDLKVMFSRENKVDNDCIITKIKEQIKEDSLIKTIEESIKKAGDNKNPFGYMLEQMFLAEIKNVIAENQKLKGKFIGLYHSVKINNGKLEEGKRNFCELDIVLLTKSGKLIVFEVKSGTMSADVSKARQYTAYATSGVYGLPILCSPLPADFNLKDDESKAIFSTAADAYRAALRTGIDVLSLEEINEKLKAICSEV